MNNKVRYPTVRTWLVLTVLTFSLLFITACPRDSGDDDDVETMTWPVKNNSANFAILIVDFDTYEFEGGYLLIYAPCTSCDADSIPLSMEFAKPGAADAPGKVLLRYVETGDSVFYGEFGGWEFPKIFVPLEILHPDSFGTVTDAPPEPISFEYLYPDWTDIDESLYRPKADSAWTAVHNLDIVEDFALGPYRVLVLLFARDKWIVFTYRGKSG